MNEHTNRKKKNYIPVDIKSSKSSIYFQEVASKTMPLLHSIKLGYTYVDDMLNFSRKSKTGNMLS